MKKNIKQIIKIKLIKLYVTYIIIRQKMYKKFIMILRKDIKNKHIMRLEKKNLYII